MDMVPELFYNKKYGGGTLLQQKYGGGGTVLQQKYGGGGTLQQQSALLFWSLSLPGAD